MPRLSKLSKSLQDPKFAKAYRKDPVAALETSLGRSLTDAEKESVLALTFQQLKTIVKVLLSTTMFD